MIVMSESHDSNVKIVYVLLDGVGDLPHPDLDGKTPLDAASTPNMDHLSLLYTSPSPRD